MTSSPKSEVPEKVVSTNSTFKVEDVTFEEHLQKYLKENQASIDRLSDYAIRQLPK